MQAEKVTFYFQKQILEKLPEDIREKVAVADVPCHPLGDGRDVALGGV
jgi:hypothetical protein